MRIAVCTSQTLFEYGGAEILAGALVERLRDAGHDVELVQAPFAYMPKDEILKGYLTWRLLNLDESEGQSIERVIALRFPAFVLPHRHKVTWLIHQFRSAYDLYGTPYSALGDSAEDRQIRDAVHKMDTLALGESRHIFAISRNVAQRLDRFNHLPAETLYPPPAEDGRFYNEGYGDYILCVSRLNQLKRVDQLVRAMGKVRTPARCLIAGQGPDLAKLRALAEEVHASQRVNFLGFVPNQELLRLYAQSLAVYYAPLDEDYGLCTVEAMKSQKPVLTTTHSGGVLEFVEDQINGFITPSGDVGALARRIDELYTHRDLAQRMGMAGQAKVLPITWDAVISRLLEI